MNEISASGQCGCLNASFQYLISDTELGMDESFAEVSLLRCSQCGQRWLRYFYEVEAFTKSGRWYLGAVTAVETLDLKASNAKSVLEKLSWYYYGGSYFGGVVGISSGTICLNP